MTEGRSRCHQNASGARQAMVTGYQAMAEFSRASAEEDMAVVNEVWALYEETVVEEAAAWCRQPSRMRS